MLLFAVIFYSLNNHRCITANLRLTFCTVYMTLGAVTHNSTLKRRLLLYNPPGCGNEPQTNIDGKTRIDRKGWFGIWFHNQTTTLMALKQTSEGERKKIPRIKTLVLHKLWLITHQTFYTDGHSGFPLRVFHVGQTANESPSLWINNLANGEQRVKAPGWFESCVHRKASVKYDQIDCVSKACLAAMPGRPCHRFPFLSHVFEVAVWVSHSVSPLMVVYTDWWCNG